MQNAIVAAEDHQFYEHNGVDLKGVARAFVNNNSGSRKQGASTLTMQYVRMSLAYSATDAAGGRRRHQGHPEAQDHRDEVRHAGREGAGQGADPRALPEHGAVRQRRLRRLRRPARSTSRRSPRTSRSPEAALLAGMVKAPTAFDPTTPTGLPAGPRPGATTSSTTCVDLKYITAEQAASDAKKVKLAHTAQPAGNGCVSVAKNNWGFFCDYFYRWWLSQEAFGATTYERERQLKSGGYRIVTSLDVKAQTAARKQHRRARSSDKNRNALLLAGVEPGTGRVRALAANRKFKLDDPTIRRTRSVLGPGEGREGHPRHLPEHDEPDHHRRRRHPRLPGRARCSRCSPWSRRWRTASRWPTRSTQAAATSPATHRLRAHRRRAGARTSTARATRRRARRARSTCGPASASR